jgi:hypothetical protein
MILYSNKEEEQTSLPTNLTKNSLASYMKAKFTLDDDHLSDIKVHGIRSSFVSLLQDHSGVKIR